MPSVARQILEQPPRALQPAVRDRVFTAERPAVPREVDGDTRGAGAIVALAVQAVRTFTRVEEDLGKIEPPRRDAETFERFRTFAQGQRGLERGACLGPGPARQRGVPRLAVGRSGVL